MGRFMTLLLDTCTFVWLASDPAKLGSEATAKLDDSLHERVISLASVWEIAIKANSGKLPLPARAEEWVEQQLRLQGIEVLPLHREVLYASAGLPMIHKDPFDRVIAADALHRGLAVVSPDEPFKRYGCEVIW